MQVQALLERLDEVVAGSRRVPLTTRIVVDGDTLGATVEELQSVIVGQIGDVDAYLRDIADALDRLRRDDHSAVTPVTAAATARVQPLIEAAEVTAERVREEAEADARQLAEAAQSEARSMRAQAAAESGAYLRRVEEATARIGELVEGAADDIGSLVETLRHQGESVAERLAAILAELDEIAQRDPSSMVQEDDGDVSASERTGDATDDAPTVARPIAASEFPPGSYAT